MPDDRREEQIAATEWAMKPPPPELAGKRIVPGGDERETTGLDEFLIRNAQAAPIAAKKVMREHGLLVIVTVPAHLAADEVAHDVATCISFGHPKVSVIYDVPAGRPETEVSVRPDAGL